MRDRIENSKKDYYEIRLESIGGLGANLCAKMLGEMAVKYLDVNACNFSSYGSEKTGTPVKGHIRYAKKEKEIRVHSPVVEPNLLVIFHAALLKDSSVLNGCTKDTTLLIATEGNDKIAGIPKGVSCFGIEAQKIAIETRSRINVVMLGAILKALTLSSPEVGEQICRDVLGKKYPDALEGNLEGIRRGFHEVRPLTVTETVELSESKKKPIKQWIGGINPRFGSTVIADVSPSRQGYFPIFLKERCINCGLCYSTCPDMVFQFKKGEFKGREMMVNNGLDYYHCKGCLRCVEICPVNALVRGLEAEHPHKAYFMPNKDLLRAPEYYEKTGPDGYITSESFLTEKRMEGGEV